jgi:hypothetical protein
MILSLFTFSFRKLKAIRKNRRKFDKHLQRHHFFYLCRYKDLHPRTQGVGENTLRALANQRQLQ